MALSSEKLKKIACDVIDSSAGELAEVSSTLWNNPELKMVETFAHKTLTDFFESHEFSVERNYVLDTGFRCVYGDVTSTSAKRLPNLAVLCEYDALPDIGHACGHNLIAEVGVATALGVKAALGAAKAEGLDLGKLTVLGTPGEEGGAGKVYMINGGAFDSVDAAMMAHPFNMNASTGDNILAITRCTVTYSGRASHAAAFPWEGVNALDAAVMAYSNVSVLRQQMKPTWRVHGVITKGGTVPNIIPELTELLYYIRAPTTKELQVLVAKVNDCFEAAAKATGCKVKVDWEKRPYDNMITNPTLLKLYEENSVNAGYPHTDPGTVALGSTDMGNVSYVTPSIHPWYSIGAKVYNHTRDFTAAAGAPMAQSYTLKVAKALAMSAIDVYWRPELVEQMRDELDKVLA